MTITEYTRKLAKDSGKRGIEIGMLAGCSEAWGKMFLSGAIKDPKADVIERLYVALTGRKLFEPES